MKITNLNNDKSRKFLLLIFLGFLALVVRVPLFRYGSLDYQTSFGPLYQFISSHSVGYVLANDPSSYTPIYTYFMVLASRIFPALPPLLVIKLVSISFDFLCAIIVYQLVKFIYPSQEGLYSLLPTLGFVAVLFSPTVILNSSFWGQADAIYTAGLLACLYFLIQKKETLGFIAFGLAAAFKLQAVFLFPLLLILSFQSYIRWRSFIIIPLVYLLSILPQFLAGRPITSLFSVYLTQSHVFNSLSMYAANLYQWLPDTYYDIFYPAGIAFALSVVVLLCIIALAVKVIVDERFIILAGLFSCLLMPYILPKMHDRYFFPADVISIVFAFYNPRYFYIPILVILISFFSYSPALFGVVQIPLPFLAIVMGIVLVIIAAEFMRKIISANQSKPRGSAIIN